MRKAQDDNSSAVDPFYSESNIRYLEKKMEDYKAGRIRLVERKLIDQTQGMCEWVDSES